MSPKGNYFTASKPLVYLLTRGYYTTIIQIAQTFLYHSPIFIHIYRWNCINTFKADAAKNFKTLKTDVAKIRKDVTIIVSFFDSEYLELRKRVDRIEEHLSLPPLN